MHMHQSNQATHTADNPLCIQALFVVIVTGNALIIFYADMQHKICQFLYRYLVIFYIWVRELDTDIFQQKYNTFPYQD